jgi:hypothetical protein
MKLAACLLFILFAKSFAFAQELKFNEKGIAETTIPVTAGTSVDLYDDVLTFISKYYVLTKVLEKDSIQKTITLEIAHFDSFNRKIFPARRPLLHHQYNLTYTVLNNEVALKFQHVKFFDNEELEYYLSFSDLLNGVENPLIFKDDKAGMIESLSGVAESLDYYLKNKEIRY